MEGATLSEMLEKACEEVQKKYVVDDDVWLRQRTRILMPIYKVKWCCIVLNAFLPAESERRRFAGVPLDETFFQKKLELAASICQEANRMNNTKAKFS